MTSSMLWHSLFKHTSCIIVWRGAFRKEVCLRTVCRGQVNQMCSAKSIAESHSEDFSCTSVDIFLLCRRILWWQSAAHTLCRKATQDVMSTSILEIFRDVTATKNISDWLCVSAYRIVCIHILQTASPASSLRHGKLVVWCYSSFE